MKKIILTVAILVTTITQAQKSLFKSISTKDLYTEYLDITDSDGDGTYNIAKKEYEINFKTSYLPTGEGYRIESVIGEGKDKGFSRTLIDAALKGGSCKGYPYESALTDGDDDSFVAIGDYVFLLNKVKADGTFNRIKMIYIKKGAAVLKVEGKKKKKSFKQKMLALKALKDNVNKGKAFQNYGPEHKALQKQDLNAMIKDYLVAMQTKQASRTSSQLNSQANIKKAKIDAIEREKKRRAGIKRYNDSVSATPAYVKLRAHQARMNGMEVTIYNKTGRDIYVSDVGSGNFGSFKINSGSYGTRSCKSDLEYSFSNDKNSRGIPFYSGNSACRKSVTVK